MDILIKGMGKMPRNCEECDVKAVCKNYWKLIRTQYTRPSWCPLIFVSPHGRLIDADALIEQCHGHNSQRTIWGEIEYLVDNAPTIIPASEEETE